MNKVILLGRLTKDPEVRYSQSAEPLAIARYTLAVDRRFKRDNEQQADFLNCVALGKQGEFAEKYLKKGMLMAITGRLQSRSWDDQNGTRHFMTEVLIEEQEFAESKSAYENRVANSQRDLNAMSYDTPMPRQSAPRPPAPPSNPAAAPYGPPDGFAAITESIDDDDLPF
jgi:single-strand DNA-binding protein